MKERISKEVEKVFLLFTCQKKYQHFKLAAIIESFGFDFLVVFLCDPNNQSESRIQIVRFVACFAT